MLVGGNGERADVAVRFWCAVMLVIIKLLCCPGNGSTGALNTALFGGFEGMN